MLTLLSIDASTPEIKICESFHFGRNNFAHANATAEDIALELFNPYPVGISDSKFILIFVL